MKKKFKPKFNVLKPHACKKRVKDRWRKPRGIDNKKRVGFAYTGASPCVGYKNSAQIRGVHPCGLFEILVHNANELKLAVGKAARIASGVGRRKREELEKIAEKKKIKLLN